MSILLDPDVFRGASYRNMVAHLTGPLGAGAEDTEVAIDASGAASVDWSARHPLLVAALRAPADAHGFLVTVTLPGPSTRVLDFARYTEAGAFLPVYVPPVDPGTHLAAPFSVKLTMTEEDTMNAVHPPLIAGLVELRVIEGLLGRMLFVCSSEKARLRREGRTIAAMRRLETARDNALDRIGADLGVPRFIGSHEAGGATVLDRETDEDYRLRLGVYRPWLRSTRQRVLELLNGDGTDADPNAGPLGTLGLADRFSIVEEDNPFAVTVKLVAAGNDTERTNFLSFVKGAYLIWPRNDAASNATHAARFLPASRAARVDGVRQDMRKYFQFTGDAASTTAVAPMLADALVRAAKCREALGLAGKWEVTRTQKDDGGSRYELGLGVDVTPFTTAELKTMAGNVATANPAPEIRALLDTMSPQPPAQDNKGSWLLEKCGLRTAFRVDSTTLYLSHLPIFGLTIDGPGPVPAKGWAIAVPGFFGRSRFSGDLLLYDRSAGEGQFLGLAEGIPTQISLGQGWRTSWTNIVGGRFGGSYPLTDLLFYERSSGAVEFYSTTADGAINLLGSDTTATKWSSAVSCELGKTLSGLFWYDRANGEAQFSATDGHGHLAPVGAKLTGLRRGWTDVVHGRFGGDGVCDLLFFDRETSEAQLCTTDGYGTLQPFADLDWDQDWTHVVAGDFTASQTDDLVFYDSRSGTLDLSSVGERGTLTTVAHQEGLRPGWTHLSTGSHGGSWQLFAYDRTTGEAAWYVQIHRGPMEVRHLQSGWRKSEAAQFEAHYASEADPSSNVVLADGIAAAAAAWTGAGNPAWTVRTSATAPTQQARWAQAVAPGAAAGVFTAAGLPAVADPAPVVVQLNALPGELVNVLELPAPLAGQITAGSPDAAAQLRALVGFLRVNGISAALPLAVTGGGAILVTSVIGLPQAGVNLAEQPSTGFRWYDVPIDGPGGTIQTVGARTTFLPTGEGLSALVAIGYARVGLTDPYEYRPELQRGALLSPPQYEMLMNLLEFGTPVGVRVNTYSIRNEHVDLNADGQPDRLDPTVSRTYRKFRRRRHLGEFGVSDKT